MASCPKCKKKLSIFDVSQFCPACGVNMRFYNFEENFIRETKLAELSQAGLKVKLRNLKYAFSGSKYVKARLIVMLLPLLSFLIPSCNFSISYPLVNISSNFGILGLVDIFTKGIFGYILDMCSSLLTGAEFSSFRNALFVYLAAVLFSLLVFVTSIAGFISIKNMQKITTVISALGALTTVASFVMIILFCSKSDSSLILTGSVGVGSVITFVMFLIVFFVNLMLWKTGIHPVYDEGVEERVRIYKLVKAGKINLDDLPQPVVETEATRRLDEEIAKEEKAFYESFSATAKEGENV